MRLLALSGLLCMLLLCFCIFSSEGNLPLGIDSVVWEGFEQKLVGHRFQQTVL
jgi:hypothetical protein